jgi:protein-S-isoprenylcysteine O-methyltransferase Ste14
MPCSAVGLIDPGSKTPQKFTRDEQMENQPKTITPRTIVLMLFFVVVIPFLPLLISRQWDWWEAWIYAIIGILGFATSRILAARRHPDLLAERARLLQHEDAKPWDKLLSPLVGLGGGLIPLVVGLDALYGWSPPFSVPAKIVALFIILAGYALGTWALMENRFFSSMVRIQTDRGHQVVSSGPYRWIRHPGYTGALLTYLATPIFLDSRWAFLPALFLTIVLVIRTRLEDKALQDELEGYRAYTIRVRYRLLPGVW